MKIRKVNLPLDNNTLRTLKAGDYILLDGIVYTARDAAHKRIIKLIDNRKPLPFELKNAIIYYTGPTPVKPGQIVGSIGPTTSSRMDIYTPILLKYGLKGMIGKGKRSKEVVDAIKRYKSIYFSAIGGTGALLSKKIKYCEVAGFRELGPEAIYKLKIEMFPVIVINDIYGNDFYTRKIQ